MTPAERAYGQTLLFW